MATATTATAMSNDTDARFRAWGSWISSLFTTFGWTAVGSAFATGTNWTDVTAPAAANTARVTELWRMNDSAQATAPLFLLIDYGETSVADTPALRIRLGTGGSGTTLSGQFFDTGATFFGCGSLNNNSMTHYASGDAGRICVFMAASGTSHATTNYLGFSIERRINSSGAAQATGFLFARWATTTTRGTIGFKNDGTSALSSILSTLSFPIALSAEANLTFDGKQCVAPLIYCGLGPIEVGLQLVVVPNSAYAAGNTFSVTAFGSSHTYICIGPNFASLNIASGSAATIQMAMRYE